MKNTLRLLSAAVLLAAGGLACAADSSTLNVSANVLGNCKITGTAPVSFGSLDPAAATDVSANGSVTFWCTKSASYTLALNNGANALLTQKRMKGPGATDFISYALTPAATAGLGLGKSTPIVISVAGLVTVPAFADAATGNYTDAVTVNITP